MLILKSRFLSWLFFKEGKMLFYNSFPYQTSEDIAYYIMYALKLWEVNGEEITISGIFNDESEELSWLKKYVKSIKLFPIDELAPYPASLETPTSFINLLNPTLCE